jgi:hypothetical protein
MSRLAAEAAADGTIGSTLPVIGNEGRSRPYPELPVDVVEANVGSHETRIVWTANPAKESKSQVDRFQGGLARISHIGPESRSISGWRRDRRFTARRGIRLSGHRPGLAVSGGFFL